MPSSLKYYREHEKAKHSARAERIDSYSAEIEALLESKYNICRRCHRPMHRDETVRYKQRQPRELRDHVICLYCFEALRFESVEPISEPIWDGLDPSLTPRTA
jgi:RNase P subunit RPR2